MKVNEIAIKRVNEVAAVSPTATLVGDGTGLGPTGFGAQDEEITSAIGHAVTAGTAAKILQKIIAKKVPGRLLTFIPGFGLAVGFYFAGKSLIKGDWVGAILEAGIGAAGGSLVANAGAIGGIAYLIYRDFYYQVSTVYDNATGKVVKKGTYPLEDWWAESSPDPAEADHHAETHAMFGQVYTAVKDFVNGHLQESPEFEEFAVSVKKKAESGESANPKRDALLNDIFKLAFS